MRILIIDDEVQVAEVLAQAVTGQGHTATVANDGKEGLALLGSYHPDAVFLDVAMPEMSGIEVLRRIRSTHPSLPVVLITGHAEAWEVAEARRLGVVDVVQKPLALKHLVEALAGLAPGGRSPAPPSRNLP